MPVLFRGPAFFVLGSGLIESRRELIDPGVKHGLKPEFLKDRRGSRIARVSYGKLVPSGFEIV